MTSQASVIETPGNLDPSACRHHWVIEPASGPLSPGVCQVCGETREFKNYLAGHAWDDYTNAARSASDTLKLVAQEAEGHEVAGGDEEA